MVASASHSNNAAESRYSLCKGDCLAAVWVVEQFKCYLFGTQFTLVIDHQPLKLLIKSDNLTKKLARWAIVLQEYNFQVMHRSKVSNLDADDLNRISCTSQKNDIGAR